MILTTRLRHSYDHRLRDLVRSTGNIEHATRRGIPRSTARGWLSARRAQVVTLDVADQDHLRLQHELLAQRRRADRLMALLRLMVVLWKVSGFSLSGLRFSDQASRVRLLAAIDRAHAVLPLRAILSIIGLSQSRYHAWKRDPPCGLDDAVICPRSAPHQLTPGEGTAIKEMVTSEQYRHVPTATLARLAQRLGKVFASPTTWYRLVRRFRWRRPRKRVHPTGPKVGIRASRPDQIWHIDTTVIRLLDGTDESQDELSAMRAADGAGKLIIGPCKSTPDACSASNRDGQKHWPTRPGDTRRLKSGRHRHSSLWSSTSFSPGWR